MKEIKFEKEIALTIVNTVATPNKTTNKKWHKFKSTCNYCSKIKYSMSRYFTLLKHTIQGHHDSLNVAIKMTTIVQVKL